LILSTVRDYLTEQRAAIRRLHDQGATGRQTGHALTDCIDEVIVRLYHESLVECSSQEQESIKGNLALVAVGGYGRCDIAPFSDVDLLLLHGGKHLETLEPFIRKLVRNIWDVGLSLGQSVTTTKDLMALTRDEVLPATSLMEARLIIGSESLWTELRDSWRKALRRGGASRLCQQAIAAIKEEQEKFGSSVHLLEPNVKRTAGGLRDLHLIRWLAIAFEDSLDFHDLEKRGILGAGDASAIEEAHEFLLRLRAELHFHANAAADVLLRGEQWRIAHLWGYEETRSQLPVERFMREYYFRTTAIVDIVERLLANWQTKSYAQGVQDLLLTRRAGRGMKIGTREIVLTEAKRAEYVSQLESTLELFETSAAYGVDIDRTTIEHLRRQYGGAEKGNVIPPASTSFSGAEAPDALTPEAIHRFMTILSRPGNIAKAARRMHQVGVLERVIPEFEHARCLLQFNEYHKYTVDEHTFVMLEEIERFATAEDAVGRVYRRIARKDLLHLAVLLHDLGKGFSEDHSEIGRRIAEAVADRFHLPESDRSVLVYLVHKHLLLSHLAYRRDTSDPSVWLQMARDVGSGERLRMLYVLTVADNIAVGPGTFTQWKKDLLAHLYTRALSLLGEAETTGIDDEAQKIRQSLLKEYGDEAKAKCFIEKLPAGYLIETSREEVSAHLLQWSVLAQGEVATLTQYQPSTNTVVYTILAHESLTGGIFHKICGALAAHHLGILAARIHTMPDGTIIDRFEVVDTHHTGPPSSERCKLVSATIRKVLTGELEVGDVLWSSRPSIFAAKKTKVGPEESRVEIDNSSSESCTVIDVFTSDRRRLLFHLTSAIYRLGLSIELAKIATYADQVVDVFYVQSNDGQKITDPKRLQEIQSELLGDLRKLSSDPRAGVD
jgi:[protein-PII] uridylyltransferase